MAAIARDATIRDVAAGLRVGCADRHGADGLRVRPRFIRRRHGLDDRISAKFVIVSALFILLIGAFGILSVDASHVFYFVDVEPKAPGSAPFSSTGERVFLLFAAIVGLVSAPVQASSRSLLARLAPPEKITQYFGLFAFSGKVTAFLAPFLVAAVTAATGSQRLGMSAIALFLVAGMMLMLQVHARPSRQ